MIDELIVRIKSMYNRIPLPIIRFAAFFYYLIPARIRYGKIFQDTWKEIIQVDNLNEIQYVELINNRFKRIVHHAIDNVPFYRDYALKMGFTKADFNTIDDITKLPIIDKSIIRQEGARMLAENINPKDMLKKSTSGSTGTPLHIYFEKSTEMREWAYVMKAWGRVGYEWDSSKVVFRSNSSFRTYDGKHQFFWDPLRRELRCNIHEMDNAHCEQYCLAMEKYKPEFMYGYPSAILQMCKYIENRPLQHRFKAVLLVSESVTENMREFIERVIGCQTFSFYGHTERALFAAQCKQGTSYHIEPTYGYAELLDEFDNSICDGADGELVVTGFENFAMPFLRYKTGDIAAWDLDVDCDCIQMGKSIKEVKGRTADFLYTKSNNLQSAISYTGENYLELNISQFQFVQTEKGKVIMKIVVTRNFSECDMDRLISLLKKNAREQIDFEVEIVDYIERGKNGKCRLVVNYVL